MAFELTDRVAVVTGAARGIGRAIALRLAAGGADVVVADIDEPGAQRVAREVERLGRRALAVACDVSSAPSVEEMVRRVLADWKKVEILVNNAGIAGPNAPVASTDEADWDRVMAVNLKSVFLCSRAVVPHMVRGGWGRIVNVASIAGKEGNPNLAAYSTSKAGIIGFTKALAKEVATAGVTVNAVSPAVIRTEMLDQVSEESLRYMLSKIPMGRPGTVEEVAAVVHFLASEEAAFVTGQCYDVSGGRATY